MKHHSPRQQEKRNFLKTNSANFPPDKGGLRGLGKEADCRSHSASLHSLAMTVGLVVLSFVFSVGIFGGTSWAAPSSISVESVPTYTAGSGVSANQFNLLTGTIRGIYNYLNNNNLHFFGINAKPLTGIGLNIGGSLQLGKVAGNSPCNTNLAGSLYFNTENKHFWYCNGTNWRELDKKVGHKYTCTDEVGDGTGTGKWVGGAIECAPVDYDSNGYYDVDPATSYSDLVCVAKNKVPDNALCNVGGASSLLPCEPKNLAYETRCYDGNVWQYDDCGNKVGFSAMTTCTLGCTETQVTPNQPLPDGAGLSPMHPQYTSGVACAADELGCGTGADWADPYAADDYKYIGDSTFYDSPRDPNTKFAGFCDEAAACGSAESVATSVKPVSSGLCDAGTPSAVVDGWHANPDSSWQDSNWHWTCGTRPCEAPHREWIISPWGDCASNGKQSRGIYCYRHN